MESPAGRINFLYLMDSIFKNAGKVHADYKNLCKGPAQSLVVETYFLPTCKDDIKCAPSPTFPLPVVFPLLRTVSSLALKAHAMQKLPRICKEQVEAHDEDLGGCVARRPAGHPPP